MVRLTITFYLYTVVFDCGVCMLISMVLLSNGFEAKKNDQRHENTCRKILVFHIAERPCSIVSKELYEQNEEEDFHNAEVLFVSPKKNF